MIEILKIGDKYWAASNVGFDPEEVDVEEMDFELLQAFCEEPDGVIRLENGFATELEAWTETFFRRLEAAPEWLAEALPHKVEYWSCGGEDIGPAPKASFWQRLIKVKPKPVAKHDSSAWRCLFYTKEDAEAHAYIPRPDWKWDRQPAIQISLSDMMAEVRQDGDKGVVVESFQDGEWVDVHRYPADQPLPEALR